MKLEVKAFLSWRARTIPVEKLLYHLQGDSLLFIHLYSEFRPGKCRPGVRRQRQRTVLVSTVDGGILIPELNGHDPIRVRALTGTFLPHAYMRALGVKPKTSHGRGRRLAAFPKLCMQDFRQILWRRRRRILAAHRLPSRRLSYREVGFGVATAHQNGGLVVSSSCLFGCLKCA